MHSYAQAIAGIAYLHEFDPSTAAFHLSYRVIHAVTAPTVIFVSVSRHYLDDYCATVTGGRAASSVDSRRLMVTNSPSTTTVGVTVTPGACGNV